MESNPLRGLFGVSSPRPVEQRVAPQPTEPTENENVCFEIPSGMIEKLLDNPFAGDGTMHPDEHLIYVDEVCGSFKLAGIPDDVVKRKVFPLSLEGDAMTWYRLSDVKLASTPMPTKCQLDIDPNGKAVDQKVYRSMIGSLIYLCASRPDIMLSVCMCARFQAAPKESHHVAVKRILRYLAHTPMLV